MEIQYFERFTTAYLKNYFKRKAISEEEWQLEINGIKHTLNHQIIIEQILNSAPGQQKLIVEALQELDSNGGDIGIFLQNLARESLAAQGS